MGRRSFMLAAAGIIGAVALGATQLASADGTAGTRHGSVPGPNAFTASAACSGNQLGITVSNEPTAVGLSHVAFVIRFVNNGAKCTLYGYPGVDGYSANGVRLVSATRTKSGYLGGLRPGRSIPHVTLASGSRASALLEWVQGLPNGLRVRSLRITAPNTRRTVTRSPSFLRLTTIRDLAIHPVVAGTSGSE